MSPVKQRRHPASRRRAASDYSLVDDYYVDLPRKIGINPHGFASRWIKKSEAEGLAEVRRDLKYEVLAVQAYPTISAVRRTIASVSPAVKVVFDANVRQLAEDVRFTSSIDAVLRHPSYLRIIGLGEAVLPCLLEELESGSPLWFPALVAIHGEDVGKGASTVKAARDRWLEWGRSEGLL